MEYNLEGKVFRSISNTGSGEVGADTLFHYHQAADIVTAEYSGGSVVTGHLIARVLADGRLDMRTTFPTSSGRMSFSAKFTAPGC